MSSDNNWYVLTGGPASGKTTLLNELQKLGYVIVPEAARTVIDEALAKGVSPQQLRKDEQKFQDMVIKLKIKTEAALSKSVVTFFDRGMHDTIAYLRHYNYTIEEWVAVACDRANYQKVFLLEPLKNYVKDYARTEDDAFHQKIHHLLNAAYEEAKMKVINVPPVSVQERLALIMREANSRADI